MTDETKVSERTDSEVDTMYDALIAFVKRIEASTATTRNHYGDYMALMGAVKGMKNKRGLAHAIIKVGANKRGVRDGFKAATGEDL